MALDPKRYALADQPWPYRTVAALLTVWNYEPVGDHSAEHLMNIDGFLTWEKRDKKTREKKAFVISNPKWRAHGMNEPVWPAKVVVEAMSTQEVCHRTGSRDDNGDFHSVIPMNLKPK